MINHDKSRAQFEACFPIPCGMQWDPSIGQAGGYIQSDTGCCTGDCANRYAARWEAWQASRDALRITNPFRAEMGDPDGLWARDVAEKSLRSQGLKVVG